MRSLGRDGSLRTRNGCAGGERRSRAWTRFARRRMSPAVLGAGQSIFGFKLCESRDDLARSHKWEPAAELDDLRRHFLVCSMRNVKGCAWVIGESLHAV